MASISEVAGFNAWYTISSTTYNTLMNEPSIENDLIYNGYENIVKLDGKCDTDKMAEWLIETRHSLDNFTIFNRKFFFCNPEDAVIIKLLIE